MIYNATFSSGDDLFKRYKSKEAKEHDRSDAWRRSRGGRGRGRGEGDRSHRILQFPLVSLVVVRFINM
jgi:hypothetical protein